MSDALFRFTRSTYVSFFQMCLHHTTAIFCAVKPTQHHLYMSFVCSQCTQGMHDAMAKYVCVVLSPTCQTVSICVCFVSVLLYLRTREKQRKNVSNHPWSSSMAVFVCAQHFWDVYEDVRSSLPCLMRCFTPPWCVCVRFLPFCCKLESAKKHTPYTTLLHPNPCLV